MNLQNILTAADTSSVEAGGQPGFFSAVGDVVTKGVPAAVVSGITSLANTSIFYKNKILGGDTEELDAADILDKGSESMGEYYRNKREVIDTAGTVVASFIPGTMAVKTVRAISASRFAGAGKYLGFTAARNQEAALSAGLKAMADKGPSVFGAMNVNKMRALAWGTADNVLQAAAFEVAAAAALYRSPTLKEESMKDLAYDIGRNALIGGAIGGAIEGVVVNGIFKKARLAVDAKLRNFDTVATAEKMGLTFGDEVYTTVADVLDIVKRVDDGPVKFGYQINGKSKSVELATDQLTSKAGKLTADKALEMVQGKIANFSAGDPSIGRAMAKKMIEQVRYGLDNGLPQEEIAREFGDIAWGLKKIQGLGSDTVNLSDEVFYFSPGRHVGSPTGADLIGGIVAARPNKNAVAYQFSGPLNQVKTGILGFQDTPAKAMDAWAAGMDAVLDARKGEWLVNPASQRIIKANPKKLDEALVRIYHPRSGVTSDSASPVIADLATQNSPLKVTNSAVLAGQKTIPMSITSKPGEDAITATARHVWVDEKVTSLYGRTISWDDFSLLNKAVEDPRLMDVNTLVKLQDGSTVRALELSDFPRWVVEQKVAKYGELVAPDHRVATAILGVEPQWVERMTANGGNAERLAAEGAVNFRPLSSFKERDNLILHYDRHAVEAGPDFLDGVLAYRQRVDAAKNKLAEATASVLPKELLDTLPDIEAMSGRQARVNGAGPGFLSFSNADYTDPLRAGLQATGQWLQQAGGIRADAAVGRIQAAANRIQSKGNLNLGAVTTFFRRAEEPLTLVDDTLVDLASVQKGIAPKISMKITDADTLEFIRNYHSWHAEKVTKENVLRNAQGLTSRYSPDQLYLPPIDTRRVPYFALVKETEGRAFSSGGVSMITAQDAASLEKKVARIRAEFPQLEVHLKGDTAAYYKAQAAYEFNSGLNSAAIDSALKKRGILSDFDPVMDPKAVIDEYVTFMMKGEQQFLRNAVSTKNAQLFSELDWLSEQHTKLAKSRFGFLGTAVQKKIEDPFGDYKRLGLNISPKAEYPIWQAGAEFVDAMGERAYKIAEEWVGRAKKGEKTWEEASAALEKVGIQGPFTGQEMYFDAQLKGSGNLFRSAIAKANSLAATVGLRLDQANAMVNTLSSPILQAAEVSAFKHSLRDSPELRAKVEGMLTVTDPATKLTIPSIGKLWGGAMANFFGKQGDDLLKRYEAIGAVKSELAQFKAMMESLALVPTMKDASSLSKTVDRAVELGAGFTGNNFAEKFTRFVSADMMRQITQPAVEAGRMSIKEQDTFIRIFVNRTQGNYVSSQRPIAFQGVVGSAISLFQTYAFNFYQQMFRHIENRDWRTLAVLGGMQAGLFGLNGLPQFDAINTHLIGAAHINEGHNDAYSTAVKFFGKEAGDWAMYGSLSALPLFTGGAPALYSRGDLNPRHLTILPTSFADVPAVSIGTRLLTAVKGFGDQVVAGGDLGSSMLQAIQHNGLSRPLAGLAVALQGESTTSKGSLIAAHSDFLSVATAVRVMGARPMDEAVALQTKFRQDGYKALDRERLETLGAAVKQKIRHGGLTGEDVTDFAAEYASRGGNIASYNAALRRWMKDANQSVVNQMMDAHNSRYGQQLMQIMGGDRLKEFKDETSTDTSGTQQ